jgi:hypothetical protein
MAVRQAWINGVEYLIGWAVTITIFWTISNYFKKIAKAEDIPARSTSQFDKGDALIGSLVFRCVGLVISTFLLLPALDYILNPQWQAIKILIDAAMRHE